MAVLTSEPYISHGSTTLTSTDHLVQKTHQFPLLLTQIQLLYTQQSKPLFGDTFPTTLTEPSHGADSTLKIQSLIPLPASPLKTASYRTKTSFNTSVVSSVVSSQDHLPNRTFSRMTHKDSSITRTL